MVVDSSQVVSIPKEISLESASVLSCGVITGFGAVVNTAKKFMLDVVWWYWELEELVLTVYRALIAGAESISFGPFR